MVHSRPRSTLLPLKEVRQYPVGFDDKGFSAKLPEQWPRLSTMMEERTEGIVQHSAAAATSAPPFVHLARHIGSSVEVQPELRKQCIFQVLQANNDDDVCTSVSSAPQQPPH